MQPLTVTAYLAGSSQLHALLLDALRLNAGGLRVGVVGLGRIGASHARTLVHLDTVSSVTLVDLDLALAESLAEELGARTLGTAEQMIAEGLDALVVATSTPSHVALLELAASAGLATFCEKPVALDLETLDGVLAAVDRAGILVQIGFQRRFDAGYRAARDAVATGEVGTLLVLRAATHDPEPPSSAYVATSGGIFRDLHIHDFDAIRFVTGEDVVEVFAAGAVRETAYFAEHGDVDVAVATLRLSGGALAVVSGTRRNQLGYDVRLEVLGTGDNIVVGMDARSPIRSVEPDVLAPQASGYGGFLERFALAYRKEVAAFVEAVRDGGSSPCTLGEARAALRIALAADRSRVQGRPVSIEEVA